MINKEAINRLAKIPLKRDLSKILNELVDYIEITEKERDSVIKRLEEFNKDTKIQELTNELRNINDNSFYIMSEKERESAKKFQKEHYEKCKSRLGTSYILTGTGIGTNIKIRCNKCKTEEDISDYGRWWFKRWNLEKLKSDNNLNKLNEEELLKIAEKEVNNLDWKKVIMVSIKNF